MLIDSIWPLLVDRATHVGTQSQGIALIEFLDYQCPFCQQQYTESKRFLASNPGRGLGYLHLPSLIHPAAEGAARSAICAEGLGRFSELHKRLFETDQWKSDTNWVREASAVGGVDTNKFLACLRSNETTDRIERDCALAQNLGVSGTPAFVYRSGVYVGLASDLVLLILSTY
ncbi:MAG: DsbA family protein [Gemmatimonadales bacterium]